MKTFLLAAFLLLAFCDVDAQRAGTLDSSFGENGKSSVNVNQTPSGETIRLKNGNLIRLSRHLMMRILLNGLIDSSFGENGVVTFDPKQIYFAYSVLEQPDGKLVVGGLYYNYFEDGILLRYNGCCHNL